MTEVLAQSVSTYKDILKDVVKQGGSQILFIDDSPFVLEYIRTQLQLEYNILTGYILQPNPIVANHVLNFLISEGVNLQEYIKCAVLDIDFGMYNKDINVNQLIELFITHKIPIILFSGIIDWKKSVKSEYHDKVKYIKKDSTGNSINLLYTTITEYSSYEIIK